MKEVFESIRKLTHISKSPIFYKKKFLKIFFENLSRDPESKSEADPTK